MDNSRSFENITDAIAKTNDALATYDLLVNRAEIAQATVSALEADVATLRSNSANLDAKTRGAKFTVANSALSLAQGDLQSVQDALLTQKTLVVAIGKASASRLFEVRDTLRSRRQTNVAAGLSSQFDWTTLPGVRLQDVANAHRSLLALGDLGASQLYYQVQHGDDFVLGAVRHLDEHWLELKQLVEAENVELSIAAIVVPTIAKAKPAVTGNQLGTLNTGDGAQLGGLIAA
jgi:hypothetical protein